MKEYNVYMEYDFGNYIIKIFEDGKLIKVRCIEDVNKAISTLIKWTNELKDFDVVINNRRG